ncbi:insulinase family protein [Vibrio sp. JC009]|uniref:M16 family metallopeptidase n=1 Tax=Vibrio sp. JC009 TaxID=2912314 RepID=UPI0023B1A699|nr:pitrilysin family protein [Vibrio sp. JC009]WED21401.1 insulinase family protein [Vibrio sp. JC009]
MKKVWLGMVSCIALYGCAQTSIPMPAMFSGVPDGVTLIEEVDDSSESVHIPYSKYQLENGLTIILSPDHSDPLVHVDVTYHVGSAREEAGRTGFAHFYEHMMFQGSEHVGDQEHFKIVTEAGGSLNGTTSQDRTNYYQTIPANQLEKVLWLESDRMGFLIDAVSQKKFEIQRATVKNERAQNYDNRPYGLIWEKMAEAMYPEGHPYSWQTIGYVEDLDQVDVNDLKAFFLRWYGPNNATITIGGDINEKQTLKWISKYFASIPSGPEVKNAPKMPVTLAESRFITLEDRIRQPMVMIGWPTGYRGDLNQPSLDSLATILGDGKNSVLYQQLIKTEKAIDAGAFHHCGELACAFYVYAMGDSGEEGNLTSVHQELISALEEFEQSGADQEMLDQIIGRSEAGAVFALQSVSGKVSQLASNETFYGQPDRIQANLERIRSVTPQSIHNVWKTYISNKNSVTLSVIPKGKLDLAVKAATFITPPRTLPEYKKVSEEDLNYTKAQDDFDRSVMPQADGSVHGSMPDIYRLHLDSGVEVIGTESNEIPTVLVRIQLPAGNRFVEKGKEGLAVITAEMMMEGTPLHSSEELQAELDKMGSSVSFSAGNYTTTLTVSSLRKNIRATLEIAHEMLSKPVFKAEDFERLKKQSLEGLIYEHQKPLWLASQATRQVLFGDSVYGRSSEGTIESLESLTLEDVVGFYNTNYTPQGTEVVVVGDLSKSAVKKELAFLENWHGHDAPLLKPQLFNPPAEQKIYLVDKPEATQSVIRLVRQGLPYDAVGEQYLTRLANYNLAGNFNSRINQNLREDKGYTYGASGYHAANREIGLIVFSSQVKADSTLAAIKELIKEMDNYAGNGLTAEELNYMRLAVGQQDALKYETPSKKSRLLQNILVHSLDEDYIEQRYELLDEIEKDQLDDIASKWFRPQDYQIIVVGDAKSLLPELKKLSIPLEQLEITK